MTLFHTHKTERQVLFTSDGKVVRVDAFNLPSPVISHDSLGSVGSDFVYGVRTATNDPGLTLDGQKMRADSGPARGKVAKGLHHHTPVYEALTLFIEEW